MLLVELFGIKETEEKSDSLLDKSLKAKKAETKKENERMKKAKT